VKKFMMGVLIIGLLALSACSFSGGTQPIPTSTSVIPTLPTGYEPPEAQTWLSPGRVQIGNFYPGATAEWNILVHNGENSCKIEYYIGTEAGETAGSVVLPEGLVGGSLSSVVSLVSNYLGDRPSSVGYNVGKKELAISGLAPSTTRKISIVYLSPEPSTFSIYYKEPDSLTEGFSMPPIGAKDWVIVSDPSPVLAPKETREIMVSVVMPQGATAPNKWEFWIGVAQASAGMVQVELCSRWTVEMRGY